MSYAVLSMPTVRNMKYAEYYKEGRPANLADRADSFAKKRGLLPFTDYEIFTPMTRGELMATVAAICKRRVVYIDAHGQGPPHGSDQVPSTIGIPVSAHPSTARRYVHPADLGLRESSIELLVAGICHQDATQWEHAVPPGCVVIGYSGTLKDTHYPHLFERFVDLRDLLKDGRSPRPHEISAWQDHILEWFERTTTTEIAAHSTDWFITVGKN